MFIIKRVSELFKRRSLGTSHTVDFSDGRAPAIAEFRARDRRSCQFESNWDDKPIPALSVVTDTTDPSKACVELPTDRRSRSIRDDMETYCCEEKARREIERIELHLQEGVEDAHERAKIYNRLGNAYFATKAFGQGVQYYYKSWQTYKLLSDSEAEAYVCGRMADAFRKQHLFREGIFYASLHVNLAEKGTDEVCKFCGYFSLASQYYFRAKYHLLESDSFEEEKNLEHRMNTMKLNLSLSTISEDLRNAAKFFTIAAEGFQRLNYDRRYATACYYIGDALFLLGECKKANSYLLKSLQVGQEFDDCRLMYLTYSKLSSTCALLSEYSLGNTYSKEMMAMRNRIVEKKKAGCPCRQLDTADTTSERHWAVSKSSSCRENGNDDALSLNFNLYDN
ncbi:hypothetical protein Q1695_010584 [Nippostrongylus brasiliensis]|nr:hypothetical protein Q1695_010584 [Nippostrongylus brasiliensis]